MRENNITSLVPRLKKLPETFQEKKIREKKELLQKLARERGLDLTSEQSQEGIVKM